MKISLLLLNSAKMLLSGTIGFRLTGDAAGSPGRGEIRGLDFKETLLLSFAQYPPGPRNSLLCSKEKDRCLGRDLVVALLLLLMSGDVEGAIQLTLRTGKVGTGMVIGLSTSPAACELASAGTSTSTKVSETER